MEKIEFQKKVNSAEKDISREKREDINRKIYIKKAELEKRLETIKPINILSRKKIESQIKALESLSQSVIFGSVIRKDSLDAISKENEFTEIYKSIKETFFDNLKIEEESIPVKEEVVKNPETTEDKTSSKEDDKIKAIQDVLNREPDEIDKELEEEVKIGKKETIEETETIEGIHLGKIRGGEVNNIINISKKINWSKLNPLSWFKKKEKGLIKDNSLLEEELLDENNNEEEDKNDDIEKVLDEKIARVKNEKKKTLYTKEQQKEFFDELKEKLKSGEITEADFKDAILKRTEEIHNFEKSGVIKAMDKWDNWGKEGGFGRYAKMAINIAMIAGISTLTVNGMTGLTEKVASRTLMGTSIGGVMTFLDKLPPEKKSRFQKIMKGTLVGGSALFAIGTGGILPGLAIGASAAFGYGMSKYYKNWSEKNSINLDGFKKIPIDLSNIDTNTQIMELKMKQALKQIDKDKVKRKIIGTAISIFSSIGTLEASEFVHDHMNNTETSLKNDEIQKDNELANINEKTQEHVLEKEKVPEIKNENIQKSYISEKEIEAVADNGQGAISSIKELQKNLSENYKDVPADKIPENVKHIIDSDPNKLAREYGMYRPGEEAESAKMFSGDKLTFDQETGEVKLHQAKTGEDITLGKDKIYGGEMFDSDNNTTKDVVQNENAPKTEELIKSENLVNEKVETGLSPEDQEYIKIDEVSDNQKLIDNKIKDIKTYAESYGVDTDRNTGETDNDYLNRMEKEINAEKLNLKNELISGEKISLEKTLEKIHGEKIEIDRLKDLKELTKGYEGAVGQSPLKEIMEKIKTYDLKAVVTKEVGETPVDAQISINEKMSLVEKSLGGQKGFNYEFIQRLPSGKIEILHIKLFKE